jgi:hypothetical protein
MATTRIKKQGGISKVWNAMTNTVRASFSVVQITAESTAIATTGAKSTALQYASQASMDACEELGLEGLSASEANAVIVVLGDKLLNATMEDNELLFTQAMAKQPNPEGDTPAVIETETKP